MKSSTARRNVSARGSIASAAQRHEANCAAQRPEVGEWAWLGGSRL
jgi:hypothetical protein